MSVYRLQMRTLPNGAVRLGLGWGWRFFFIGVTAAIVSVLVQEQRIVGLLPAIGLITLFAAMYRETWLFDPANDLVESRIGICFVTKVRRYRLSRVRSVRVRTRAQVDPDQESERRGRRPVRRPQIPLAIQRGYVQLILELAGDQEADELYPVLVQTESVRHRGRVFALARGIGSALDIPVTTRFG